MKKTVFLSIIVPVYNVSRYIVKCISSILNQDIEIADIEIIIVNDGTPDDSIEKIQSLIDENDNIKLIVQENKGLSEARNAGLRCATGTYVWFVDSDDWISRSSIKIIKEYSSRFQATECFFANVITVDEMTGTEKRQSAPCEYYDKEITGDKFLTVSKFITPIQKYIFKRDFLLRHNAFFVPNMFHEDVELTIRLMPHISSMVVIREYLYYYLQRGNGNIMSQLRRKNVEDIIFTINQLYDSSIFMPKHRREIYKNRLYLLCMTLISFLSKMPRKDSMSCLDSYEDLIREMLKYVFSSLTFNEKVKSLLLMISPKYYVNMRREIERS